MLILWEYKGFRRTPKYEKKILNRAFFPPGIYENAEVSCLDPKIYFVNQPTVYNLA